MSKIATAVMVIQVGDREKPLHTMGAFGDETTVYELWAWAEREAGWSHGKLLKLELRPDTASATREANGEKADAA